MSTTPSRARTRGAHHVGLTVPDLDAARSFFVDALGFETVGEVPDYPAAFLSDGTVLLTLWRAADPATAVPFDRHANLGLHHFALAVPDADTLTALGDEFAARDDVEIEFAPEPLGDGGARHLMCRIPGGLRMELIALP
jgi:catechol 2,3-dioxygenase-like lactoylglutathione lyase family enzyme